MPDARPTRRLTLPAIAVAVVLSATVLVTGVPPHLWLSVVWSGACLVAMIAATTVARRALWFNAAVVLAAVAVLEGYAAYTSGTAERRQTWSNPQSLFARDDALGHRPPPGHVTDSQLWYGDELIYDVTYTIDDDGLRIAPPTAGLAANEPCVLFFGGSYTFGEGVNDDQTMPWLVAVLGGHRYQVRNFGFAGYGPHQMLAAIESGLVERVARCTPRYAVYQAHPHHLLRAAGKWWWDEHGPRYELDAGGEVTRNGNFDDDATLSPLADSEVARRLSDSIEPAVEDVELLNAIVQESHRLLERLYPGIEFHVLYWDVGPPWLFDDKRTAAGLRVHRLSAVLPHWDRWEQLYTFDHDVHPTPRAHFIIARHVIDRVLPASASHARTEH